MEIPKVIKQKINKSIEYSKKSIELQRNILKWFESKGINTESDTFIEAWGYFSNNECSSAEEFEQLLNGENPFRNDNFT